MAIVSKETLTRITEGERVVGEVVESGDAAIVRIPRPAGGAPHVIAADEWHAFTAAVRALDKYVPNGHKPAPRRVRPTSMPASAPLTDLPTQIAQRLARHANSRVRVTLANGMQLWVGKNGLRVLRKLAERPEQWREPRSLGLGWSAAGSLSTMVATGLVDRIGGRGKGSRGSYRITAKGMEALKTLGVSA